MPSKKGGRVATVYTIHVTPWIAFGITVKWRKKK
jgi:hypothetical protein